MSIKNKLQDYRPDIDGLRALAVLPVLLFHTKLGCPGGFVGVDVFFVISGFLISSLILKELDTDQFSLITFCERRIRRILPALVVVILAALIGGWYLYLPEDFEQLGKSVIAQAALVSNVFFYSQDSGYFAPDSATKPLLHTWSLAVEEQFYLLFPLLLMFLTRYKWIPLTKTIGILAVGSFLLSVLGSYYSPAATFYFLPTRAWELLLGSLLATMRGKFVCNRLTLESFGWLGIGLIVYAIFGYNENTRFPGLAAVPPCLGATMIIASSEASLSQVGRILSFRPLVFIGLISYSLYLWHWPVLAYSEYLSGPQKWKVRAAVLLASTVPAILSWKFVETPFRKRRIFQQRPKIFAFAGLSMAALLVLGFLIYCNNGVSSRFSDKAISFANSRNHYAFRDEVGLEQAVAGQFVELGKQNAKQPIIILIWGDSHAMAVTPVLDELCHQYSKRGIEVSRHGIAPVLGFISSRSNDDSNAYAEAVLSFIRERHVKNVILSAHWKFYATSDSFKNQLLATVHTIRSTGAKVYLLKDVPYQNFDVPRFTAITEMHHGNLDQLGISPEQHLLANHALQQTFEQIAQIEGVTVLDPADCFLNRNGLYGVVRNGLVLYIDSNHLTIEGSKLLKTLFEPIFTNEVPVSR